MGSSQSSCFQASSSAARADADDRDWKCAGVSAHDESTQPVARPPMTAAPAPSIAREQAGNTAVRDGRTVIRKKVPERGRSASRHSQREPWTPALTRTPSRGRSSEFSRQSIDKDRAQRLASLRGPPPLAYRSPRSPSVSRRKSQSRPGTAPNGSKSRRHDSGASASASVEHVVLSSPAQSKARPFRRSSIPADFGLSPVIKSQADIQTVTRQVHAAATSSPPARRRPALNKKAAVAELSASPILQTSTFANATAPSTRPASSHSKAKQDSTSTPALPGPSRQKSSGPPSMPLPEPPRRKSPMRGPALAQGHATAADKANVSARLKTPLDPLSRGTPLLSPDTLDLPAGQAHQTAAKTIRATAVDEPRVDQGRADQGRADDDNDDVASLSTSTSSTRSSLSLGSPAVGGLSAYSLFPRPGASAKALATVPSWMDFGYDTGGRRGPSPAATTSSNLARTTSPAVAVDAGSSKAEARATPTLDAPLRQIGLALLRAQR